MLKVDVAALTATAPVLGHAGDELRGAGRTAQDALLLAAGELQGPAAGALGALLSASTTAHQVADGAVRLLGAVTSAGEVYSRADQVLGGRMAG